MNRHMKMDSTFQNRFHGVCTLHWKQWKSVGASWRVVSQEPVCRVTAVPEEKREVMQLVPQISRLLPTIYNICHSDIQLWKFISSSNLGRSDIPIPEAEVGHIPASSLSHLPRLLPSLQSHEGPCWAKNVIATNHPRIEHKSCLSQNPCPIDYNQVSTTRF